MQSTAWHHFIHMRIIECESLLIPDSFWALGYTLVTLHTNPASFRSYILHTKLRHHQSIGLHSIFAAQTTSSYYVGESACDFGSAHLHRDAGNYQLVAQSSLDRVKRPQNTLNFWADSSPTELPPDLAFLHVLKLSVGGIYWRL